jgi:hypothetical protein
MIHLPPDAPVHYSRRLSLVLLGACAAAAWLVVLIRWLT